MKKHAFKLILTCGILAPTVYYVYDGYNKSTTLSTFELAASKLGFNGYKKADQIITAAQQQEALLTQFQIAGYFQEKKLWEAINHLGFENPEETFKQFYVAIKKSKADQEDPNKFNAKILRKNLGKNTELDQQDMMDFLLYTSQNAFGRASGQERNELNSQDWMNKYSQEYLTAAKALRLIDREAPHYLAYDGAWIAGASRIGLFARIIDYKYVISNYDIKINGETAILAGARPLWANIDGIIPSDRDKLIDAFKTNANLDQVDISLMVGENKERMEEGKEYMLSLATKYNIKLNPSSSFVQYTTKEECPPGYFPNRVYPNYDKGEVRKLTETLMSEDMINTYLANASADINVVDTLASENQRPNTATTARDVAMRFMQHVKEGKYGVKEEFVILFQTNNPYIERQTLATERELQKIVDEYNKNNNTNYKIKLDGVGFGHKQDIVTVHSESAALMSEKWKVATGDIVQKRPIEKIQFQTRDKSPITLIQSNTSEVEPSGQFFQDLFDEYL
jgi:hypothetical protein